MCALWQPGTRRPKTDLSRRGFVAATGLAGLTLAGCTGSNPPDASHPAIPNASTSTTLREPAEGNAGAGVLIAYFSRTANTRTVAEHVAAETSADLFRVVPQDPYPDDYDATNERATKEQDSGARPRLSSHVQNIDACTTVLLGYPIWWSKMPMAMFTFLEEYDFRGKTILPFCTHEGSGLASSERDIARLAPGARLSEGLAIRGPEAGDSRGEVAARVHKSALRA
ncbi:flavodoxin [Streptomyces sp. NPDC057539]|uniref:flavodoxin n=1 Tax=Streptomyces sp. NPDC057539 TaxID=3346159 RepID=UPI00368752AD